MSKIRRGWFAALALCLTACQDGGVWFGNTTPPHSQTLVFDNYAETASLDPGIADSTSDSNIVAALFEGLVQSDPLTARPMAALATHYEVSADGMRYTFYLRGHPHPQGTRLADSEALPAEYSRGIHAPPDTRPARWSDGTTITAHDFVYAWRRVIDPQTAAPMANYLSVIKNAALILAGKCAPGGLGVSAPDDFTLRVELQEPTPYLLSLLVQNAFKAVPRRVIEKARRAGREELWLQPGTIVTSGPFVLTEWRPYDYVRVRKSATYYQADLVRLESITFLPINAGAAVANLYRSGGTQAMDIGTLPEALTPALLSTRDFRSAPILGIWAYAFNVHRPPFDNVLLRYALNMALDKSAIGRYLNSPPALDLTRPSAGYSGPQSVYVTLHGRDYNVLEYNPAAARELLVLAGYPNGIGTDGRPLAFDVRAWTDPTDLNLAQILTQQWLTNLHVHARLSPVEFNVAIPEMRSGNFSGVIADAWVADYADPMALLTPAYVTDASGGWTDAQYLSLLSDANRTFQPRTRFEKLRRAEARLLHEMPIIPLAYQQAHTLRKPYVHALDPDPLDAHYFRYAWIDTGWKP